MLLPLLFLFLAFALTLACLFQKVRQNKVLFIVFLSLIGLFSLLSLWRGILFAQDAFKELDKIKVTLATIFLYLTIFSVMGFIIVDKQRKLIPSLLLAGFLAFGVAFLAFAFTYGRTNLDNEKVISSSSSAAEAMLLLLSLKL